MAGGVEVGAAHSMVWPASSGWSVPMSEGVGTSGFMVAGRWGTGGQSLDRASSADERELKFDLFFLFEPADLFGCFAVLPCTSRIDFTDAPLPGVSADAGVAEVAGGPAAPKVSAAAPPFPSDFQTFSAGFFRAEPAGAAGATSGSGRAVPAGFADRRIHSHAPSMPSTTPPSTAHSVFQLEVGLVAGGIVSTEAAELAAAFGAGCKVAGTVAADGLVTGVPATTEPAVSVRAAPGVPVSAAGCAHAAGTLLKAPSSASNSSSRRPPKELPADCGTLTAPGPLVERLRVMKHLG